MYTLPRRLLRSSDIPISLPEGSDPRPSWVLFYFGLVFLLSLSVPIFCELSEDLSYKPVPAKILSYSVESRPIAWREDHIPKITYSYSVNGVMHTASRVFGGLGQHSYYSTEDALAVIKRLGTADGFVAYVDPKNSSRSLLERFWEQPISFMENLMLGLVLSACLIYLGARSN